MFDRMSKTYGLANLITSFGFTAIWRKQCLNQLALTKSTPTGYDLMSGMGEAWGDIQERLGDGCRIIAVDISDEMNRKAANHLNRLKSKNIEIRNANVLKNNIPDQSADFIVSTFGLKTFKKEQQQILAAEVHRILKPGGTFSFIEISKPKPLVLKWLYMFYLKIIIPLIGKIFLGNTDDYRMLGRYCADFGTCEYFHSCLVEAGLKSNVKNFFFGCATGVYGAK
nr:class I SAM-dependent methyltransferase [Fulvivirga sedimenti]